MAVSLIKYSFETGAITKEQKEKAQKKAVKAKKKQGRRGPIRFVKDIWSELKKVTWQLRRNCSAILWLSLP